MSLGCLLRDQLGIALRRSPSGKFRFAEGEAVLSAWMASNAFVAWQPARSPWELEPHVIAAFDLPLNLMHNGAHTFAGQLSTARRLARNQAEAI
jgi:hypothetical protein